MKKKLIRAGKRAVQIAYGLASELTIPLLYGYAHRFGQLKYLDRADLLTWRDAMRQMLRAHVRSGYASRLNELIPAFADTKIEILKKENDFDPAIPIVVLCVKNDRRRIEMLVEHYRRHGVGQFAFLDNGSTDGTLEWLLQQPDVDLYRTEKHYTSFNKEAWINRLVSYYGFDRWYILTDSDELVTYDGIETHPFPDVLRYADRAGLSRIKALTLDMYTDGALFGDGPADDIRESYCWTDTDSFLAEERPIGGSVLSVYTGGPRYRAMNVKTSLSKYPLVYFSRGTVSENAHFQYPYGAAERAPCHFAILHYKFLEEDKKVYKERSSRASGFARGGGDYKNYMKMVEENSSASFMYPGSLRLTESAGLRQIPLIQSIDFEGK